MKYSATRKSATWTRFPVARPIIGRSNDAVTWKTNVISPTSVKLRAYRPFRMAYTGGWSDSMVSLGRCETQSAAKTARTAP